MRKFWNLMLAVLVIVGAAACTENNDSVDVKKGGLSFYAERKKGRKIKNKN